MREIFFRFFVCCRVRIKISNLTFSQYSIALLFTFYYKIIKRKDFICFKYIMIIKKNDGCLAYQYKDRSSKINDNILGMGRNVRQYVIG